MSQFIRGAGDWTKYRQLENSVEVDFHHAGPRYGDYHAAMNNTRERALAALRSAQENGAEYVLLVHGNSTSGQGRTTQRSVIRELIRSRDSSPFVVKSQSIQHPTVFIAKIKKPSTAPLYQEASQ